MKIPCDWLGLAVFATCVALALAAAPLALGGEPGDPGGSALCELMRRAFERTFQQPGLRSVELRVERSGQLVSRRVFDLAYRRDGEVARSLVLFTAPEYLRGNALLIIDQGGRSDTWLYQPEERRPRRVGTAQKGDAFYGSDLSFEDLELPHWERWRLTRRADEVEAGRACAVVEAVPERESQYAKLLTWIDTGRSGVARIDFYHSQTGEPVKRLRVSLADATEERGFLRIAHMEVEQLGRDARTRAEYTRMAIDPALAASVFSALRLERAGSDLFDLAKPGAGSEPTR
jgi:hypothetical protein